MKKKVLSIVLNYVNGAVSVHDGQYFSNHATAVRLTAHQKSLTFGFHFLSLELITVDTLILINLSLVLFIIILSVCFSRVF